MRATASASVTRAATREASTSVKTVTRVEAPAVGSEQRLLREWRREKRLRQRRSGLGRGSVRRRTRGRCGGRRREPVAVIQVAHEELRLEPTVRQAVSKAESREVRLELGVKDDEIDVSWRGHGSRCLNVRCLSSNSTCSYLYDEQLTHVVLWETVLSMGVALVCLLLLNRIK